jgi:hypothetical protein
METPGFPHEVLARNPFSKGFWLEVIAGSCMFSSGKGVSG